MKRKPAPKWTAKARPVEEAGRKWLRSLEQEGDQAIERAYIGRLGNVGGSRKDVALVSLGAIEVLMFVRAIERREIDQAMARSIAARLRKVIEGASWNEAFDAPWAADPGVVTRTIHRDWELYKAFLTEFAALKKVRSRATMEEARQKVAAKHHASEASVRKAVTTISTLLAAKSQRERK